MPVFLAAAVKGSVLLGIFPSKTEDPSGAGNARTVWAASQSVRKRRLITAKKHKIGTGIISLNGDDFEVVKMDRCDDLLVVAGDVQLFGESSAQLPAAAPLMHWGLGCRLLPLLSTSKNKG